VNNGCGTYIVCGPICGIEAKNMVPIPAPPGGGACGLVCASEIMNLFGISCNYFNDKNDWRDKGTNGFGYYYNLGLETCSPKDVGQWLCDESKKCSASCQCGLDSRKFNTSLTCQQWVRDIGPSSGYSFDIYCYKDASVGTCTNPYNGICGYQARCPGDDGNCATSTWQPALQAFFVAHGLKTFNGVTNYDTTTGKVPDSRFDELMSYVRKGIPVIFHVKGHYMVISNYNDETQELTFIDSRHAQSGKVKYIDFKYTNNPWWAKWVGCYPSCQDGTMMNAWDGRILAVWKE
jgi:hypothetical protein